MGLLEDAIKQHLDLKRQHGADPREVEQQARDEGDRPGAVSADLFDAEEDEEEADEVLLGDSPGGEEPAPAEPRPDQVGDTPEDVLDATPEFLEETPEHDRLWFEQKPPRDFDF